MLRKEFAYHNPSPDSKAKLDKLREAFSTLGEVITTICPNSRHKYTAVDYLETSAMWAIKSVVYNDPDSKAEGFIE